MSIYGPRCRTLISVRIYLA